MSGVLPSHVFFSELLCMSVTQSLLLLAGIILASAFFSIAEIALAAARPLKLRQLVDEVRNTIKCLFANRCGDGLWRWGGR